MDLPLPKQDHRLSYRDYCLRDDEKRREIIDGVEYDMTAPSRIHQEVSGELFVRMHGFFKNENCKVYSAPFDARLPETENAGDEDIFTVVQPDITVVCDPSKLDDRGCKGSPDLIVEILSPSNAGIDMKIKRGLYEKCGVKEYWIVHPMDKIVMLYSLGQGSIHEFWKYFRNASLVPMLCLGTQSACSACPWLSKPSFGHRVPKHSMGTSGNWAERKFPEIVNAPLGQNDQYDKATIYTEEDIADSKLFPEMKIELSDIFVPV